VGRKEGGKGGGIKDKGRRREKSNMRERMRGGITERGRRWEKSVESDRKRWGGEKNKGGRGKRRDWIK